MICLQRDVALDSVASSPGLSAFFSGLLKLSQTAAGAHEAACSAVIPWGQNRQQVFRQQAYLTRPRPYLPGHNASSPMFVLGCVRPPGPGPGGSGCPPLGRLPWPVPAVIPVARLAQEPKVLSRQEGSQPSRRRNIPLHPFSFDVHMMGLLETMVKIGGYIMLFYSGPPCAWQMANPAL